MFDKHVIHCKTKEEYEAIVELIGWHDNQSHPEYWIVFGGSTHLEVAIDKIRWIGYRHNFRIESENLILVEASDILSPKSNDNLIEIGGVIVY